MKLTKEERQEKIKEQDEAYYSLRSELDSLTWSLGRINEGRTRKYEFKLLKIAINLTLEQIRKDHDRYVKRIRIKDANEEVTIVEYLKEVPTIDELKKILKMLDIPARKLVRTNEVVWKENYKGKDLTEEQLIEAMINNPKLIERPIAIKNGKAVIGRPPENVLNL